MTAAILPLLPHAPSTHAPPLAASSATAHHAASAADEMPATDTNGPTATSATTVAISVPTAPSDGATAASGRTTAATGAAARRLT